MNDLYIDCIVFIYDVFCLLVLLKGMNQGMKIDILVVVKLLIFKMEECFSEMIWQVVGGWEVLLFVGSNLSF